MTQPPNIGWRHAQRTAVMSSHPAPPMPASAASAIPAIAKKYASPPSCLMSSILNEQTGAHKGATWAP